MFSIDIEKFLVEEFGLVDTSGYRATKVTDGLSGAEVYILEIIKPRRKRDCGVYILKIIDTLQKWYDQENNEVYKSKKIYSEAVRFQEHLVKVRTDKKIGDKLVMILSYAFGEKLSLVSLEQLKIDKKLDILENISYDLLSKLNNLQESNLTDQSDVIEGLCSYRIGENGNFSNRIKKYVYEINKPAININGCILPNPYYYITCIDDILKSIKVQYIKGSVHGDLHQKNILTLKDSCKYVVIDYDSCSNNYLLFDQAYLELNCYMQLSEMWSLETWLNGMPYIFRGPDENLESVEFAAVIGVQQRIQKGIERWYNQELPNCLDSFRVQFQLARIAAGINFFSKSGVKDSIEQLKYLIYISYGFKSLFSLIDYQWEKCDASRLINKEVDVNYVNKLWNECGKLRSEYIKILITDDVYDLEKYSVLTNIGAIDWKLIVDVGRKTVPNELVNILVPILKKSNGIEYVDNEKIDSISTYRKTNILRIKRRTDYSIFKHWTIFKEQFIPVYKAICSNEPLKSVLFVLDFHDNSTIRERIFEMLWEENLVQNGSRFICLGKRHEIPLQVEELAERNIEYFEHDDMNLEDISRMINYFGLNKSCENSEILLPAIESLDGQLTKEEWNDYNSDVEIVYSGIERELTNYTNGEDFYKGNEITWLDLAQRKDIEWDEYRKWKENIVRKLQTERIAECRLLHGAGAGGTTLAKRLMWDIKDINPTLRIRKYNSNTANVIVEIYRKTGKSVFVVLEMGSTIISEDEYENLKRSVNAQSCHALFLRVERTSSKDMESNAEIYLNENLRRLDAIKFYNSYSTMTNDPERKKCLTSITYDYMNEEWQGQCCPFFYGFYTFQEEYRGIGHFLENSIVNCEEETRRVLADLSIITIYSQNICMPYEEFAKRLDLQKVLLVEMLNRVNSGIQKILIQRDDGLRICHPLIARKLLELLYNRHNLYSEQLYFATMDFIDSKNDIYGKVDRKYLDKIFKELFIDRSYIDGEQQKFAQLINELEKQSFKMKIFEKLKKMYADNPHYYNHLGRLEIYDKKNKQFDKAVANLKKALKVAEQNKYSQVPHYTTLGCIYSEKVIFELQMKNRSVEQLLENIKVDFGNANDCFERARELKENTTYAYFPNILMICNVVGKIADVTRKTLEALLQNPSFAKWYDYYSGIAIQLYGQMKNRCYEELSDELRRKAEENILRLKSNVDALKIRLKQQKKVGLTFKECNSLGRSICMLLYMQNEYKWENLKQDELQYVEKEMESILEAGDYNQNDVNVWFSVYRQMQEFDYGKAKRYLIDYMEEGYYKKYLLWILSFAEYQKGVLTYSPVEKYLNECRYNQQLVERCIRTTQNIDAYTNLGIGFPIRRVGSIKNESGELLGLKSFKGQIISIDGTVRGKIRLDGLDEIIVTFVPSFTIGDKKVEFTRADISSDVEFNLIFTYSGYKAWNLRKI